jgi:serine/threonine-protein kinase
VPFDARSLEVRGNPVPIVEGITVKSSGAADFSISANGQLVYALGAGGGALQRTLVWIDRQGREEAIAIPAATYAYPRLSPDGLRVALDDRTAAGAVWIWDLGQQTRTRLTTGDAGGQYPVWTSDGIRLAYNTDRDIFWKASNNTGTPERLVEAPGSRNSAAPSPYFFSPDGSALVLRDQQTPETDDDLVMISLADSKPVWRLQGRFRERNAELSPDGRWMAYESDETGEFQIYVRPFPAVDEDQVQVSNAGGVFPLWSRDGRELFYVERGSPARLMAVRVEPDRRDGPFTFGERLPVVDFPGYIAAEGRTYDVSPDGRRFLVVKDPVTAAGDVARPEIEVVLNWHRELLERVPIP